MTFIELQNKAKELKLKLENLIEKKDITNLKVELEALTEKSKATDFWNDNDTAQNVMRNIGDLTNEFEEIETLNMTSESISEMLEESSEDDLEVIEMLQEEIKSFEKSIDKTEISTYLSGKFDSSDCILSIHAGQGGTEAMDWTEMLLRMYTRYCNSIGWKVTIIDQVPGTEAGLSSVNLEIKGRFAYGYLKHEHGTHRLVRNSPFNSQGLRQTSFSGVEVIPVVEVDIDIELDESELDFTAMRSGGPGGQNVNKVASKVRIVHKPTGIVVESSAHRTQHQNRETAMRMLKAKLYEIEEQKQKAIMAQEKGEYKIAGWGNQIRNYVLQPYKLVKDVRTGVETSQSDSVLDGNIQAFIDAEVRML
ncbi:MAG: peptide chain release factor 2 [Candidatus Dojkabacteria bacterium]|nr:peptide chain release factor 2 [Candidatus Dojkabacteria bacterium]MDQ7021166.1 peptide chain release factor 2 [Candidatus Dojkabacteria bacterium]